MPVAIPGFSGGDRTSILLPAVQTSLLKALQTTGKPVVFVLMTGSAIAMPWEAQNIPAIVNAWYGGQSAGTAIADVLFGDYNPAGRLPVTFYASDKDLPDFNDYSMSNRTYRYFKGQPLYPFGYGLSYTTFSYDALKMPATLNAGNGATISVRVTNTGAMDGEEVVQLYVSPSTAGKGKDPIRELKGFQRVFLKKGESRTITFTLKPENMAMINEHGTPEYYVGRIMLSIGGCQPNDQTNSSKKTVQSFIAIK